ncbi:probable cytochrome P450 313a4 [Uranotaenia lowii]|uniref:probable cytochrome P450 313a4 n=1 Tax=Uranotaenia lowii TaxID=190385 RepID=UPI002479A5C6|nr:probable cytochrome P450 313a4 [Uranotaenia lowii]
MWGVILFWSLATLVAVLIHYKWSHRKILAATSNMSSPLALPIIGHTYLLYKIRQNPNFFNGLKALIDVFSSPSCLHVGPLVHIIVYEPEQLQTVLNSQHCISKPIQYNFFHVNRGIFAAPVSLWRILRKSFSPCFGAGMLPKFVPIFNEKSVEMVKLLECYLGRGECDISLDIGKCTLDTIYSTACGMNLNLQSSPDGEKHLIGQHRYVETILRRVFNPIFYPNCIFRAFGDGKQFTEAHEQMRAVSYKVMVAKNSERPKPVISQDNDDIEGKKQQMFIDKLYEMVREDKVVHREDIIEHLDTISFAGNDTTSTTLVNCLLMLAMFPEVQDRVYQEIMLSCPIDDVSIEDVSKLVYTEMVCKETMRLFPVGPMLARTATADFKLDDNNMIPAGATLVMVVYILHRNVQIWGPDANEFNPDHFLPEQVAKRHPYSYLPFSGGPRNCLGIRYAWISMKIMLVHILRKYRLHTTLTLDTLDIDYSLILKIKNGCQVSLELRV